MQGLQAPSVVHCFGGLGPMQGSELPAERIAVSAVSACLAPFLGEQEQREPDSTLWLSTWLKLERPRRLPRSDPVWGGRSQKEQRVEELERDLVELLDYDQFALVKELTQNRLTIVWCSRLARSENVDEEQRIQVRKALGFRVEGFALNPLWKALNPLQRALNPDHRCSAQRNLRGMTGVLLLVV